MATEIQTQTGQCATHGTVQATRDIPKMGFPFILYAYLRSRAKAQAVPLPGMRRGSAGRLNGAAAHLGASASASAVTAAAGPVPWHRPRRSNIPAAAPMTGPTTRLPPRSAGRGADRVSLASTLSGVRLNGHAGQGRSVGAADCRSPRARGPTPVIQPRLPQCRLTRRAQEGAAGSAGRT
jgi:hypothetical protein